MVATDAEESGGAFEIGLEEAVARFKRRDAVLLAQKPHRPDDVAVVMRVVFVDVPIRFDAVAQHVLVVAPHEDVRQALRDVLARYHAVVALLVEELDPVLEPILVERHAVFGHEVAEDYAFHSSSSSSSSSSFSSSSSSSGFLRSSSSSSSSTPGS